MSWYHLTLSITAFRYVAKYTGLTHRLSIVSTSVTPSLGSSTCVQIGKVVILTISCQINATGASAATFFTGAPSASTAVTVNVSGSAGLVPITVDTNGNIRKSNNNATSSGWYNGQIVYLAA